MRMEETKIGMNKVVRNNLSVLLTKIDIDVDECGYEHLKTHLGPYMQL